MVSSTVARLVGRSFGMAAIVATAQYGVANGLGIVEWSLRTGGETAWRGLRTWIVFLFGAAVLAGAGAARRTIREIRGRRVAGLARMTAAFFAGLGAAAAAPLLWLPARGMPTTFAPDPAFVVGASAATGIAVGVVLAVAGLTSVPIGVNLATTVGWVWLLALGSAGLAYAEGVVPATPRLGVLDPPQIVPGAGRWMAPFLMIGLAGAGGFLVAAARRWLASPRLGIALSGFAGPALVASAYLAGGLGGAGAARLQPYIASLLAVSAGLLASVAVSGSHQATPRRAAGPVTTAPANPLAIAGRPRRLAIEAAPVAGYGQPRYAQRAAKTAKRAGAKPVAAIAATPHVPAAGHDASERAQPTNRALVTPEEEGRLRKGEREHIDWMQNLVNTPADPDLVSRRRS